MFSIKESFADCLECKLCNATSCILETNCKYIEDVDIVFVAENPGKDECSSNPPKPLIGKAGQVFRKYFKLFDINKKNYLLTNVVLCQTILPNGNTGNPDEDVIERCKVNCFNIIERCKPKLIVLMGASPAKAFGLLPKGTGILGLRGNMTKWKDYDVLLTFHPSFIARGHREEEDKFKDDLQKAAEFLNGSGKKSTSNAQVTGKNGVFYYKIPDKFYTSDFKLIDVQYLNKTNEVLFIFRDKNNKKIYHKENDTFICYQYKDKNNAKLTMPYDQLSQVRTTFRHRTSLDPTITYEGDIKLNNKHAQDYFLQRKEEESIKFLNTLFLDIETYTDTKENSSVEDANDPICIIGYYYAGFHKTYTLDPSVLVKNNPKKITITEGIEICKSEKELITKFITDVKKIDPDIITGWYCLPENESVWLESKIKKIKNVDIGNKTFNYGKIENKVNTGIKKQFDLRMSHGFNISSSEDHIFPVFIKDKNKYMNSSKICNNIKDLTVKEIIETYKSNDVYFIINKRKNDNRDCTYRDILLESIDKFLEFDDFDIIIDNHIFNKLKLLKEDDRDLISPIKDYWCGNKFKNKYFSFKRLKAFISKDEMISFIKRNDHITFILGSRKKTINISEIIDNDDLKLLGLLYTDGFWSRYDKNCHFDNKDLNVTKKYMEIINRKYVRKTVLTPENNINNRDGLYHFNFSFRNRFSLLLPLIYNYYIKKELDLEITSILSFNQFCSLISGMIDGDGSCLGKNIYLCSFINNGKDNETLQELLLWNNVVSYIEGFGDCICGKGVYIPAIESNIDFINNIEITQSDRKRKFDLGCVRKEKNSKARIVDKYNLNDKIIVKLLNITESSCVNMYDIKTESGYFTSGGVKTHNCDGFDIPYIYYRSKKIGIDPASLSKYGEFEVDLKFGRVHIAGLVVTDMLFLYKSFTFGLKESYSLDFIANLELGEGKLGKGYNFSEMFREDPDQAIRYNQQDVIILPKLDDKLNHIMFQDEIKKICKTTYDGVKSSMARLDSLLVTFLKERGIASKNANITEKDHKFEGAYVKEPIVGLHEYMVDFDFSSLYPSLILTYNIGVNTFAMKFDDYKLGYDFCYDRNNLPDKATIIIDPMFEAKKVSMSKEDIIKTVEENNLICTINGCFYKQHSQEVSYYSQILDSLLKSRKTYKKLMFDAQQSKDDINNKLYDTKQQVYKVIANSLYGILGNNAYRFFNIDCARSITLSGQEALKTSIIETDPFVTSLQKKEYKRPKPLSREEMFTENIERNIENIVTGDTDSIFITYEKIIDNKQSEEEILNLVNKWNELVHNFLNNKIIPEVVKRHNASLDTNRLELKNELVIKRGLFLAKKRYALYVISNEGKKVDKLKPMGIETRRRDFPSLTKDKLNELLDLVLKSKQLKIPNIMKYIDETKNIFIQEIKNGNKQIARPVTFGKKEDDYTVIPQGVKGMLNWNNLEYKAFGPGSHGYLFKIQGIDLEKAPKEVVDNYNKHYSTTGKKIEEIVIPENILRLPEYYIVDVKHILKFSWIDRYSLLLEPILPKQKTLLVF